MNATSVTPTLWKTGTEIPAHLPLPSGIPALLPLTGLDADYDPVLEAIGDRPIVLIGEASHGTHEFYQERARLTKRLIEEKGFTAVAVEADWPDAYRVNRYVLGRSTDASADDALTDFKRFPTWMWRNREVMEFVEWLRERNQSQADPDTKARFIGLDLYSLRTSMQAVIDYLDRVDATAAAAARHRYSCFDHVGGEGAAYGYHVALSIVYPCEDEVISQLADLRSRQEAILSRNGQVAEDDFFSAEQNARLVINAERYYRAMYRAQPSSWNLRDRHMADTLRRLITHLHHQFGVAKVVVWEHNSHIGDARATDMSIRGEFNIGQLVRTQFPVESYSLGFTTYEGMVTAASEWGAPTERKRVRPALPGSYEEIFHQTGIDRFFITPAAVHWLPPVALERAIGVIYRPETERTSHWFHTRLAEQFDAVIHIDRTNAVEPLDRTPLWDTGEPPETFPTGL